MKKKEIIWVTMVVLFFGWLIISKYFYTKEIIENKAFTKAVITFCGSDPKARYTEIEYSFYIDGKQINHKEPTNLASELCDSIKNKSFPVLYSHKTPQKCFILLLEDDYDKYNLKEKDVLKILKDNEIK